MMKSITRTMVTSTMGFAWTLISAGARTTEASLGWGSDERASFAELSVRNAGRAITTMGERLELAANGLALWLGYNDGEVSSWVAWPTMAH